MVDSLYKAQEWYKGIQRNCPQHDLNMQQEVYIFYDGCDCENKATSLVSIAANEEESGHDQGINPRVREALKRIS